MAENISKEKALHDIRARCEYLKRCTSDMTHTAMADKVAIMSSVNEFYMYFENAIKSADPFMQNVSAMRNQGLWLPDKINNGSVKAAYYNLAKGYALKIVNNERVAQAAAKGDKKQVTAMLGVVKDINKYIDDIVEGRKLIDEN